MSWLDQLRPASFRGVAFHVDTIEHSAGDNVVLREYPFQDLPTVFRMGEAAEEIKLSAYVIGDDYDEQRESLRDVLSGEGVLVHPTAGSMRVFVAGKYTMREAPTAEGGMARFDITFVRAEPRRYPQGDSAANVAAANKAADAKIAAKNAFAAQWKLTEKPGWVADRAVARISDALGPTWAKLAKASQGLGDFTSQVIGNYQALVNGLDDLVRTPRILADQIATLFELPGELTESSARQFQSAFEWVFDLDKRLRKTEFEVSVMPAVGAGLVMYGTGNAEEIGASSAFRQQLSALTTASDQLIESLASAAYVEATARVELANYDEAMAMRLAVSEQFTRLLSEASAAPASDTMPDTSWHDAMLALHTAALADLQTRSRDLVRLTSYTPQSWQPVWYVSYQLFGTVAYADEILAMNPHIRHPLLVPPGRALRIVRHD
jgi:prophage DNA circulation protein